MMHELTFRDTMTDEEFGDYGEELVAVRLQSAGHRTRHMPKRFWFYDLTVLQSPPLLISVKIRIPTKANLIKWQPHASFDFLAVVLAEPQADETWPCYVIPRAAIEQHAIQCPATMCWREISVGKLKEHLSVWLDNYELNAS
jgi:hypothetical protein